MSAIKIGHKNILETSTVTVTNEDPDYPKYRLYDRRMGRLFKGTGAADHTIHVENTTLLYATEESGSSGGDAYAVAGNAFPPVNCTGLTKVNGALIVELKCSDWSKVNDSAYIEITSSGTWDTEEWAIDISSLGITDTYQTFNIPLSTAISTGGELVTNQIDYMRMWAHFSEDETIYWKNAKIYIDDGVNGLYIPVGHNLKNTTLTLSSSDDNTNWNTVATLNPTVDDAILSEFTEVNAPFWKLVLTDLSSPPELSELFLTDFYEFTCAPAYGAEIGSKTNVVRNETPAGIAYYLQKGDSRKIMNYMLQNITEAEKTEMDAWLSTWGGFKPFLFIDHDGDVFPAELVQDIIFQIHYNRYTADISIMENKC